MVIILLFLMVIAFMLIGVPIAVSLGLSSIIFLFIHSDASLASVAQTLFSAFQGHYTLLAIPFFILASSFMSTGGVAQRIIRFAIACGWLFSRWSGDGFGVRLHDVCGTLRLVTGDGSGYWFYRNRRYGQFRLHQGICCRRYL